MAKGRPKGSYRARIELPDGRIVTGWEAAAAAMGRKSVPALAALFVKDERGVYCLERPEEARHAPLR